MTQPPSGSPERDPLLGRVVDGRYTVTSVIARGGMSRVYRAEQAPLGRVVALKVLQIGNGGEQDIEFRQRFTLEASACARLTHPNTVRVFDHGQVGEELLYIAMEYLDGRTLHQVIRAEAPLEAARVVAVARQICGSLREAHGQGLLHRDLKPANVVLVQHGEGEESVKVLDFGLVKQMRVNDELTGTDAVVGSPSYMSPEQIRAERLDARSDVYSLGVILYACATGRAPFVADTSVGVLLAHLNQTPPPIDPQSLSLKRCRTLDWVIRTALAKKPEDRFESVDELNRALRLCEAELRGEAVAPPLLAKGRMERQENISPASVVPPAPAGALGEPSVSTVVSAIRSRRVPLLAATGVVASLAFLGGVLLMGGLGYYWYRQHFLPARVDTPVAAPPSELASLASGVHITSVPLGAVVSRDGKALGSAPLDLAIPQGAVWTFDVSADGFQAATVTIPWDARRQQVVLKPLPPKPKSEGSDRGVAPPVAVVRQIPVVETPVSTLQPAPPAAVPAQVAPPEPVPEPPKKKTGNDLRDPWGQ